MIDSADTEEDFERTQRLPLLTADIQLDEVLQRERAARIEIVELMRQNLQQRKDLERLRCESHATLFTQLHPPAGASDADANTEQALFEVCGALKEALCKVMDECQVRGIRLDCGEFAGRALEDSCSRLDHILSAPGFYAPAPLSADQPYGCPALSASNVVSLKASHA